MENIKIKSQTKLSRSSENLYKEALKRINGAPQGTCPTELALAFANICRAQSCGKCVPCRLGFDAISEILNKILEGNGTSEDIALLEKTAKVIADSADCVIGSEGASALLNAIQVFKEDFISHVENDRCKENFTPVPCVANCPANVDIPGYIALTGAGRYEDAIRLIRKDNPFPSVCGLVCEHPCENVCRRKLVDDAINIRGIKDFAVEMAGEVPVPDKYQDTGKKVAIIGGGPAGLTTAYYLSLMGHKVTVFEKRKRLGGMLRYGIPCYRLPDKYLDRDIDSILSLGVEVKLGVNIGTDITLDELKKEYDAVHIAIGAHSDKKLGIPGEDKIGVMSAVELLRNIGDNNKIDFTGKNVVVIGGGNVAMDATRTSRRLGANSVSCVYRRRIIDMTALPEEVIGAKEEGCEIVELQAPVRVEFNDKDEVTGLVVQPQIIGAFDRGRAKPFKANKPEEVIPCDIIIVAIGQEIENQYFAEQNIPTKWDQIVADDEAIIKGHDGLFSGGDCVSGPLTVIKAIEAGKVAANSIDKYLGFNTVLTVDIDIPNPPTTYMQQCGRINMKERPAEVRKEDFEIMEIPMTEQEAKQECGRCLRCDCFGFGSHKGGRTNKW
ncbi:MAG: FAD-dependent oxidoreductase [Clostridiales bacterium]|nr:FAD-dependent oxidoreductase [Clostridiales bacterium]